jgi:putative tryptophan/tyrosine transport system substrate-binding protein
MSLKRREFITLVGGAAAWPLAAHAQQVSTRRPLVAVLSAVTRERNLPLNAFVQGMREFGYIEGENIDIEYRFAEGRLDRFPALADELVRLSPKVIVALVTPAAVATRALTQTIPIGQKLGIKSVPARKAPNRDTVMRTIIRSDATRTAKLHLLRALS